MATNNRSRELQNVIRRLLAASNQGAQPARLASGVYTGEPITMEPAAANNGVARLMSPEASTTWRPPTRSNSSKQGGKRKTRKAKGKRRASKKSRRVNRK